MEIPLAGVTQKRMGFLLHAVPLKVSSSCHLRRFSLATLTSDYIYIRVYVNLLSDKVYC